MTNKQDYTQDEWHLLLEVPALAGLAVMVSGKSGLGSVKESLAIAQGLLELAEGMGDVELMQALHDARVKDGERSSMERLSSPMRGKSAEELQDMAVELCEQVRDLLAAKATRREAEAYKDWVLQMAERVATAAKEGGFLGLGGERVSPEEEATIDQIATALNIGSE